MTGGGPVRDLQSMLAGMEPVLDEDSFRFVVPSSAQELAALHERCFALVYEEEGQTCVVRPGQGEKGRPFARITLTVHSDLEGVGLTAAASSALAGEGIACNVIAGFHHDHLFVPWERRIEALGILKALSHDARR
ncbi:MAG: ACT domain-containing protein [Erythrobacter sp.]